MAQSWSLSWERPYATSVAKKNQNKKQKNKKQTKKNHYRDKHTSQGFETTEKKSLFKVTEKVLGYL